MTYNIAGCETRQIKKKEVKVDNEVEERWVVTIEITCRELEESVELARDLEANLENNLKGQTVLAKKEVLGE